MTRKRRLFWAVNLPGELKKALGEKQARLKTAAAGVKWVEPELLHVTVKFLGDTDDGLVAGIAGTAAGALRGLGPFRLEVKGLGFFPGSSSPRVLWAGLKGEVGLLREAARRVEEAMIDFGFPREARKFSPHLTLARIKSPAGGAELAGVVDRIRSGAESPGIFRVGSVDLMQSELTPRGPVYTMLVAVRLG